MTTERHSGARTQGLPTASRDQSMRRIVIFAGTGRSGSTLAARLLGAVSGFTTIGEGAAYLLDERVRGRRIPCSCGAEVAACSFWGDLVVGGLGDLERSASESIRLRALAPLLFGRMTEARRTDIGKAVDGLRAFYAAVGRRAGDGIIVDSSKNPAFIALLANAPGIELRVIHLIRDPRGFVQSRRAGKHYLGALSPLKAIAVWIARNIAAEAVVRRVDHAVRLRYEELVERPGDVVGRIALWASGKEPDLTFLDESEARLGEEHLLAGNPDKLGADTVRIQPRRLVLPKRLSLMVVALTWPLMARYGYLRRPRN